MIFIRLVLGRVRIIYAKIWNQPNLLIFAHVLVYISIKTNMKKLTLSICACIFIISCAKNNSGMQPDLAGIRPSSSSIDSLNDSIVNPFDSLPVLSFDTTTYILVPSWQTNDSIGSGDSTMRTIHMKR